MDQKNDTHAKQPFMFLSRCYFAREPAPRRRLRADLCGPL